MATVPPVTPPIAGGPIAGGPIAGGPGALSPPPCIRPVEWQLRGLGCARAPS